VATRGELDREFDAFFDEILSRSLNDRRHKGCMLVNSALKTAPHDAEFQEIIAGVLARIERFFSGASAQVRPTGPSRSHCPQRCSPDISLAY